SPGSAPRGRIGVLGRAPPPCGALPRPDGCPRLRPAVIAHRVAHRQHRVEGLLPPAHARPFQPPFHYHFVPTLDYPAPDRPARRPKRRVVHLRHPPAQVLPVLDQGGVRPHFL